MQKHRIMGRSLVVLAMAMFVIWLGACASASTPDATAPVAENTADGGAALLEQSCTQCHGLDRVTSAQKTQAEWTQTVDSMIQKGAKVSDKEALVAYLAETYGP